MYINSIGKGPWCRDGFVTATVFFCTRTALIENLIVLANNAKGSNTVNGKQKQVRFYSMMLLLFCPVSVFFEFYLSVLYKHFADQK